MRENLETKEQIKLQLATERTYHVILQQDMQPLQQPKLNSEGPFLDFCLDDNRDIKTTLDVVMNGQHGAYTGEHSKVHGK